MKDYVSIRNMTLMNLTIDKFKAKIISRDYLLNLLYYY